MWRHFLCLGTICNCCFSLFRLISKLFSISNQLNTTTNPGWLPLVSIIDFTSSSFLIFELFRYWYWTSSFWAIAMGRHLLFSLPIPPHILYSLLIISYLMIDTSSPLLYSLLVLVNRLLFPCRSCCSFHWLILGASL